METEIEELERILLKQTERRNEERRNPYSKRIVDELNNKLTGVK